MVLVRFRYTNNYDLLVVVIPSIPTWTPILTLWLSSSPSLSLHPNPLFHFHSRLPLIFFLLSPVTTADLPHLFSSYSLSLSYLASRLPHPSYFRDHLFALLCLLYYLSTTDSPYHPLNLPHLFFTPPSLPLILDPPLLFIPPLPHLGILLAAVLSKIKTSK